MRVLLEGYWSIRRSQIMITVKEMVLCTGTHLNLLLKHSMCRKEKYFGLV